MQFRLPAILAASLACAIALVGSFTFTTHSAAAEEAAAPRFEAVTPEVPAGDAQQFQIRLVGADGKPVAAQVTVKELRLDMGPDGMAAMTTRIAQVASTEPGVLVFEADFTMAGRWALTLTVAVEGTPEPISGTVQLTAIQKKAEAAPPAAPAAGKRKIVYYRNPMGAPDTSPVPKKDAMGMDYIPVYEDEISGPAGSVKLSPEKIQRSGIRTALVTKQQMVRPIRGTGTVEADERRMAMLSVKFEGFVEALFVGSTGERVVKGQPLARIWIASGEILQKESDYLTALKRGDVQRAADNLRLFGISDEVIAELKRSGQPVRSIVLKAASAGTVLEKQALPGMRFEPGEMLFMLADLSTVWVVAKVAERDLPHLREGQTATIRLNAEGANEMTGRVGFIYPALDTNTRTASVRIEVANPDGRLKLGQFAEVAIDTAPTEAAITVPDSAVMDSGRRRVVFIAGADGLFEPRDVEIGARSEGLAEIRSGLAEGERIVVAGNFLLDSESNLRAAIAGMAQPAATP